MKPDIQRRINTAGLEFMGCYRAADGVCYYLAGKVESTDYGDKEGFGLSAWKDAPGSDLLQHTTTLRFFVSKSALATARVTRWLESQPDLIKRLAVAHLKQMLDEGRDTKEIMLTTSSPDNAFEMDDPSGDPLIAQRRLRDEILRDVALRHASGESVVRYETVRDPLCATDEWVQRAFRLLNKQGLIDGIVDGNLRLTDDGHLAAENLVPVAPVASNAPLSAVTSLEKPMDCFVSYAGEDRDVVKQLVAALTTRNIQVWWDKGQITLGDRLSQKIDEGLRLSRYGLVVVSRHFVAKNWPQAELSALHSRAMRSGQKVILPVLIGMTHEEFAETYPLLGDLVTEALGDDLGALADEIARAVRPEFRSEGPLQSSADVGRTQRATTRATEAPQRASIVDTILESKRESERVALGLQINPRALQISVGESGPFFSTSGGSNHYKVTRTLKMKVENVDKRRAVSGCKVYVMEIDPPEYEGPWRLKDEFDLAAGDHVFIPLVRYGEARDPAKTPSGDTFMTVLAPEPSPKPSAKSQHIVTLKATSMETAPCELKCKLWIDDAGRLRIEKA